MVSGSAPRKGRSRAAASDVAPDAVLDSTHTAMVSKALDSEQADALAVQTAKQLLASGQLDTIHNIRQAAMNLLDEGV